jgi:hypothetical protein
MKNGKVLYIAVLAVFIFSGCALNNAAVKKEEPVQGSIGNKGIVGGRGPSTPEGKKKPGMCPLGCSGNAF